MARDMDTGFTGWSRADPKEHPTWTRHTIDESFSQSHALALVDIDGDGQPELITGKRYRGHSGSGSGIVRPGGRLCVQAADERRSSTTGTKKPRSEGSWRF